MPLPHTPRRRAPHQTRHLLRGLLRPALGREPETELALPRRVIRLHRQRQPHVLREKRLRGRLARVHADGGAPRLLQKPTPAHDQPLRGPGARPGVRVAVDDLALSHEPGARDPGGPGVHARGELGEGTREHDGEAPRQPGREQAAEDLLRRPAHFASIGVLRIEGGGQFHDSRVAVGYESGVGSHFRDQGGAEHVEEEAVEEGTEGAVDGGVIRGGVGGPRYEAGRRGFGGFYFRGGVFEFGFAEAYPNIPDLVGMVISYCWKECGCE
mmetsp:Transcript_42775/g.100450  ORF Transcript_42775/g.100450 Transcript_42775/m.100450 type:complete len:269 (-) Transcript_42775:140-946(-)